MSISVQWYTPGIHTEYICVIAEDREKIDRYVNIDRNPAVLNKRQKFIALPNMHCKGANFSLFFVKLTKIFIMFFIEDDDYCTFGPLPLLLGNNCKKSEKISYMISTSLV